MKKKIISLFLVMCILSSLVIALPVTSFAASASVGGSSIGGNIGTGVVGPVVSAAPAYITDFSYDDKGTVRLMASNVPEDAIIYVAAYDTNDRLLELQDLLLYNGLAYTTFTAADVNEYKAFIWKDMAPVCESRVAVKVSHIDKVMSISLSDLIEFDGERVRYYNGDNTGRIKLASGGEEITFIYNGITIDKYDNSSDLKDAFEDYFNIGTDTAYSGQVTFIDDGTANGYSIIDLEVAVSAVVDEIFETRVDFKEAVMTTDGKGIIWLDFDPEDTETVIELTKNGEEIDYTQLAEWDVLTILANDITEEYFVEVVDNKIEGVVEARAASDTSADGYKYMIGDKWYDVASMAYGGAALKISAEGTFYIDRYGKIAAFKEVVKSENTVKYAYIINAAVTTDEWDNYSIMVRLLDESGEVYDKYLDPTVTIENIDVDLQSAITGDGVTFSDEMSGDVEYTDAKIKIENFSLEDDTRINALKDGLVNRFVTYKLSDDNVKIITFPMNEPNEDVYLVNMVAAGAAEYDEAKMLLTIAGKKYDISDETIVFYIQSEDGSVIEDGAIASKNLSNVTKATTLVTGNYNYIEAYDFENDIPKVLVVYDDNIKVSSYSNIAVVESVSDTIIDGEEVTSITYLMNGEKATAYSGYTDMFNVGDVWKFNLDGTTIMAARRITSYNRDITEPGEAGGAVFDQTTGSEDILWGPVTESRSTNKFSFANQNNFDDIQSIAARRANIYIVMYEEGNLQILVGTAVDATYDQDLIDAAMADNIQIVDKNDNVLVNAGEAPLGMMDYVYAVSYDEEIQDVVIFKGGDFGRWYAEEVVE